MTLVWGSEEKHLKMEDSKFSVSGAARLHPSFPGFFLLIHLLQAQSSSSLFMGFPKGRLYRIIPCVQPQWFPSPPVKGRCPEHSLQSLGTALCLQLSLIPAILPLGLNAPDILKYLYFFKEASFMPQCLHNCNTSPWKFFPSIIAWWTPHHLFSKCLKFNKAFPMFFLTLQEEIYSKNARLFNLENQSLWSTILIAKEEKPYGLISWCKILTNFSMCSW